jgi:alkylhydroperoxidase family enzyme
MYDGDVETMGFVMNVSRLWTQLPEAQDGLFALLGTAAHTAGLTFRQRAILVTACASAMRDSYCSLAWGNKLAREAGAEVAGGVLRGEDELLDDAERALARRVAREPNATTPADVQELRDVGYDDQQVFAVTLFLALRLAFSTVNDALGALPDRELDAEAEAPVRDAVTFGRPVGSGG